MVFIETVDNGNDSKLDSMETKQGGDRLCNVCGGKCTTRCSLCRLVYYCSVECQRKDWTERGHKRTCKGRTKRKKTPMGPDLPPPTSIQNEKDAKRAVRELWSIARSAMDGEEAAGSSATNRSNSSKLGTQKRRPSKAIPTPCNVTSENKTTIKSQTNTSVATGPSAVGTTEETSAGFSHPLLVPNHERPSFVVEEMPQICRFQLTLKRKQRRDTPPGPKGSAIGPRVRATADENSIIVSAQPLGRSGARTLVIVREKNEKDGTNGRSSTLFAGEFPRPIKASDITWRVVSAPEYETKTKTSERNDGTGSKRDEEALSVLVFRLAYPYDPSNTSSLALGGTLDHSCTSSSSSASTLDEINTVMCGSCHLPLVIPHDRKKSMSSSLPLPTTKTTIRRVFPLPQGHWDEIADYLICYDGQPVVDFSGGSQCAEPSIALQDASLLCFHRRDVEKAVCALAVDGYGDPTEDSNDTGDAASTDQTKNSSNDDDLGTFFAKPPSSTFVLPDPETPSEEPPEAEEKKDDTVFGGGEGDPPITATSAVIRGDRRWQDANDGESVSLCCGRCCSLLGFASLGSPETWRFWKHRLSIPKATKTTKAIEKRVNETEAKGVNHSKSNSTTLAMTFAAGTSVPTTTERRLRQKPPMVSLASTKPLGSCSSFLARELVRYAESKAIFTFVVTREGPGDERRGTNGDELPEATSKRSTSTAAAFERKRTAEQSVGHQGKKNNCLLLRLLSWQTAMATSFETKEIEPPPATPSSSKLLFRKVAKIVFEETMDPIADPANTSGHQSNGEGATQWFWGGVDLCCPPPSGLSMRQTKNSANAAATTIRNSGDNNDADNQTPNTVSTAKLRLPGDEYDRVFEDLMSGRSFFEKETADATILLKMGDLWEGLGLTAVVLE